MSKRHDRHGWSLRSLGEAAEVTMGSSPPGESYNDEDNGVPLINGPVEFSDGDFGLTVRGKSTTEPTRMCNTGDLLLCVRGSTTGRTNIAGFDACIGRGVASVRSKEDQRFLNHFIRTQRQRLFDLGNGSTFPSITQEQLVSVQVPLPPLPEQRRIAAILDKADAIRRKREEGIRLTEELLRSTFLKMFGDPATNPKGWPIRVMAEVVSEMEGGKSILAESDETASTKYRVLKVSAATWADYRPEESKPVPNNYVPAPSHIVKKGDLLFSRANTTELVGATVYVFDTPPNHLLPDKLWRFVWKDDNIVDPQYVRILFLTEATKRELGKRATGTSGSMKNISKAKLMTIPIPVPPMEIQRQFGRFAMAQHKALADRRDGAISAAELFGSLVQRAFRG